MRQDILLSVIIPTYNRYEKLVLAIDSIKRQSYKNIEIIVVNDGSSDPIYSIKKPANVKWIDLERSSREIFGKPSVGYTRNVGIKHAKGTYIAFLDDDDCWLPDKAEIQLSMMVSKGYDFSSTEGFMVINGLEKGGSYPLIHQEYYETFCRNFFFKHFGIWCNNLPEIFTLDLIEKHNFILQSSVIIKRSLLEKSGMYDERCSQYNGKQTEDWELWRRVLKFSDCLYINKPLVLYDGNIPKRSLRKKLSQKINLAKRKTFLFFKNNKK